MSEEAHDVVEGTGIGDDLGFQEEYQPGGRRRRKKRRAPVGCLVLLVVLALLGTGAYVGLTKGVEWAKDYFGEADDYAGAGEGRVLFEVQSGDTPTSMAAELEKLGVVASAEAFRNAAMARNDESAKIQVGFYELRKKMSANAALDILVDPANIRTVGVTIPEGYRVKDVLDILADKTTFKRARFEKALADPAKLGLPAYAEGNPEGYLFPATYAFAPNDTPVTMLKKMVDRWRQSAEAADLETRAAELGKSPKEIMIIASLVEAEGRGDDMPKIARVIYNRLDGPGDKGGTNGLLQVDASVNYGLDQKLGVQLTEEQKRTDTPYNTYLNPGLPPTPIEAPGDAAIQAALNPAPGDWYYYVTVNLRTGETKFAETYQEFLGYKAEFTAYCQTSDAC